MDIPETITKVFTKYDKIPERISIPSMDSFKPIWQNDGSDIFWGYALAPIPYRRYAINEGFEGVLFVHYMRENN